MNKMVRAIVRSTMYGLGFLLAPLALALLVNPFALFHPWAWGFALLVAVKAFLPLAACSFCVVAALHLLAREQEHSSYASELFAVGVAPIVLIGSAATIALGGLPWIFTKLEFGSFTPLMVALTGLGVVMGALRSLELAGGPWSDELVATQWRRSALAVSRTVAGIGTAVLAISSIGMGFLGLSSFLGRWVWFGLPVVSALVLVMLLRNKAWLAPIRHRGTGARKERSSVGGRGLQGAKLFGAWLSVWFGAVLLHMLLDRVGLPGPTALIYAGSILAQGWLLQRSLGFRMAIPWTLSTLAAAVSSFAFLVVFSGIVTTTVSEIVEIVFGGLVFGTTMGVMQWAVLRRALVHAWPWIPATIFGVLFSGFLASDLGLGDALTWLSHSLYPIATGIVLVRLQGGPRRHEGVRSWRGEVRAAEPPA